MSTTPEVPFRRGAVAPVECLSAGWELIKDQYWLFVGMAAVGLIIGQAVPLGILMGPMMCGLYLAFFSKRRGLPIEFGTLFKGFDYFGQSVVATLLHAVPVIAIIVPAYVIGYLGMLGSLMALGADSSGIASILLFLLLILFWIVVILLLMAIGIGFSFTYPLIVDRGMQGMDAIKLSFKGAFANFWGLLGMSILSGLLSLVGVLLCYVGVFFVLPISFAATACAYERVFGLSNPADLASNLPPPPPSF
jgi:uncharacterized membrane protein